MCCTLDKLEQGTDQTVLENCYVFDRSLQKYQNLSTGLSHFEPGVKLQCVEWGGGGKTTVRRVGGGGGDLLSHNK